MRYILLITCFLTTSACTISQLNKKAEQQRGDARIMFYNCENYFDIYNDSVKLDDEFLPRGAKYWTYKKFRTKVNQIAKVITAVGGWQPPEIVGVCEVENRYVLDQLVKTSPIAKHQYQIIHIESPDARGIDVGMLYLKDKFKPLYYDAVPVWYRGANARRTRDILYVKGIIKQSDTIHLFFNHWPSRYSGHIETEDKRLAAALTLKSQTDSIFKTNSAANIIIMGDLNDYPTDASLKSGLKVKYEFDNPQFNELYSIAYYLQEKKNLWTHKHLGTGGILDQIIISGSLLKPTNSVFSSLEHSHVGNFPFLLEEETKYPGKKPYRTYIGYKYHGGFSDHLPVYIDLYFNKLSK